MHRQLLMRKKKLIYFRIILLDINDKCDDKNRLVFIQQLLSSFNVKNQFINIDNDANIMKKETKKKKT